MGKKEKELFQDDNLYAISGFILSIAVPLSIVGFVLCIIAIIKADRYKKKRLNLAIVGLVLSMLFSVMFIFISIKTGFIRIQDVDKNNIVETNQTSDTSTKEENKKEDETKEEEKKEEPKEDLKDVIVADFSNMSRDEIKTWCESNNVKYYIFETYSDVVEEGKFIRQSYSPNSKIKEKTTIYIYFSKGHELTEAEKVAKDYKSSCASYTYEEISRNPNQYKGKRAIFKGEVVQVMETRIGNKVYMDMRVNVTKGEYGFWSDTVYVTFINSTEDSRILEDDIITMYGTLTGLKSYTSILGITYTIPGFKAEYIDID